MESGQPRATNRAHRPPPGHGADDDFRYAAREGAEEGWWYGPPPRARGLDFSALFVLLDAVRRVVPRELQQQLTAVIREALLTLRSLIDWYLERLDRPPREPEVEEIRID